MTNAAELTDSEMADIVGGSRTPISELMAGPSPKERVYEKIGMCGCGVASHN